MSNVQGEDRSSFQGVTGWGGDVFGFAKASEGTDWTDPTFAANWANLKKAGLVRGAYHFFHPADDPVAQARYFVSAVKEHGGFAAGDVFIADVEIVVGGTGLEEYGTRRAVARAHQGLRAQPPPDDVGPAALAFLREVQALAGPRCRVVLYTDLSMAQDQLAGCTAYPLFIAAYQAGQPSVHPWESWAFWQVREGGGPGGGDLDYFNGDEASLRAWAGGGSANWTEELVNELPTLKQGSKDGAVKAAWYVHRLQQLTVGYGEWNGLGKATAIKVDGVFGPTTKAAVEAVQGHAKLAKDGVAGQDTWTALLTG